MELGPLKKIQIKQSSLGGYSSEVPPLPIPNREVKLTHADGTAYLGGRVGSRLFKPNPIRVRLFCVYTQMPHPGFRLKEPAIAGYVYNPPQTPPFEKEGLTSTGVNTVTSIDLYRIWKSDSSIIVLILLCYTSLLIRCNI